MEIDMHFISSNKRGGRDMYNLFTRVFLLVFAFTVLAGGLAFAKSLPKGAEILAERFDAIDTDNDNKISKSEYMANCEKHFLLLDTNGDGYLTMREAQQNVAKLVLEAKQKVMEKAEMHFDKIDTNNDGKISLEEWKSAHPNAPMAEEWFASADVNGDGFITQEEIQETLEEKVRKRRRRRQ
jgi:Ca2+-binding EF-hand superfamily protein